MTTEYQEVKRVRRRPSTPNAPTKQSCPKCEAPSERIDRMPSRAVYWCRGCDLESSIPIK